MLKIRYTVDTSLLSGWTDNESEFDHLLPREGEATELLDTAKPDADDYECFVYQDGLLKENRPTPPLCTHWAVIDSINLGAEKPVRVKRTWEGVEYTVNCYVTEGIRDQYLAGDIVVADYVIVEFLDDNPNRAVVFAKVFKTW